MLGYAPNSGFAEQGRHPRALLFIVGVHAVAIAAVMTAKMAVPIIRPEPPLVLRPIEIPPDPPPNVDPPKEHQPSPPLAHPYVPPPDVPMQSPDRTEIDTSLIPLPDPGPIAGTKPLPNPVPKPTPAVVRTGPRFATPDWALRPPYPADKQRLEQEAVLKLRLTIDERGRVVAVDPVGNADRSFLDAARKHLIAKWRYRPATEDGRAIPSSTVITLRFELESA